MIPPCFTLSNIRYVSSGAIQRKEVVPSPTPRCSSYRKGSLRVALDYGRQLYFTYFYLAIMIILFNNNSCYPNFLFQLVKPMTIFPRRYWKVLVLIIVQTEWRSKRTVVIFLNEDKTWKKSWNQSWKGSSMQII